MLRYFMIITSIFCISPFAVALEVNNLHTCLQSLQKTQPAADVISYNQNPTSVFVRKLPQPDATLRLILISEKNIHVCKSNLPAKSKDRVSFKLAEPENTSFISYAPSEDAASFPYDRFAIFNENISNEAQAPTCAFSRDAIEEGEVPELLLQITKSLKALYISPYREAKSSSVDFKNPKRIDPPRAVYESFYACAKIPSIKIFLDQMYKDTKEYGATASAPSYKYDELYLAKFGPSHKISEPASVASTPATTN